jgi:hypothetical protein
MFIIFKSCTTLKNNNLSTERILHWNLLYLFRNLISRNSLQYYQSMY